MIDRAKALLVLHDYVPSLSLASAVLLLNALEGTIEASVSDRLKANPSIVNSLREKRKIEAIRATRNLLGCGLKEAKDAVEAIAYEVAPWAYTPSGHYLNSDY